MKDYKALAIRYLKLNKRRSVVTILGACVASMVLFTLLNLICCGILKVRDEVREKTDYEIVLCTENEEQIKQIMEDDRVKSAAVGQYHYLDGDLDETYNHALFINTKNPYRMDSVMEELCNTYGVKGEINYLLAWTYLQGDEGSISVIGFLFSLLISFIFAIFGVGIVRNSIQLSVLEQIKDYGNLRCIGASRRQLKAVVYIEGAIVEIIGILLGVLLGTVASSIIGYFMHMKAGFHFLPLLPLLIAFLGDLFFAMEENCKVITHMTPVSAIRGEFRIRKEKLKVRKRSIFGRLFGMEGDYAYKSIMRNPGRFYKTVWALAIGIAAFIAVEGVTNSVNRYIQKTAERFKYYQVYIEHPLDIGQTAEEGKSELPEMDWLKDISDLEEITEAKRLYASEIYVADADALLEKYRSDYLQNTGIGKSKIIASEKMKEKDTNIQISWSSIVSGIICSGYDEEDYRRFEQVLLDGTLDISEHGLVLINGGETMQAESDSLMDAYEYMTYSDYQVGDTIDIVDMKKYNKMLGEKISALKAEYERKMEQLPQVSRDSEEYQEMEDKKLEIEKEYNKGRNIASSECREKLIKDGDYITYTVEGIVSEDINRYNWGEDIEIILPMKQYMELTGTDESMIAGMQYHFEKLPSMNAQLLFSAVSEDYLMIEWLEIMMVVSGFRNVTRCIMLFILFIVLMATFNIINTASGNLHVRKKELAQLRVIGISKKGLMKMVMLEGVIEAIAANLLGMLIGVALSYGCYQIVTILYGMDYYFPIMAVLLSILLSVLILCGSLYVPLKGLNQDIAADLAAGGD